MTKTRVCVNPACEHHGAEQSIENFYPCGRDRKNRRRTCNDCVKKSNAERYIEERDDRHEYAKWIPDDDPETDLVPMTEGGFVRWAVLTTNRRRALGEPSSFNGLSVARDKSRE